MGCLHFRCKTSVLDEGWGITIDEIGNAYITGWTESADFPVTPNAFDTINNGIDIFITKVNSGGTGLSFSTYLGGYDHDYGKGIAIDGDEKIYITGHVGSRNFPTTTGSYSTTHNGMTDVIITKILIQNQLPIFDGHDFNNNGSSDVSIFRPSNGRWYIKGVGGYIWGTVGDIPVNGDYNGDGKTDIAVWRPSNGRWYIKGIGGYIWGMVGDIPLVR